MIKNIGLSVTNNHLRTRFELQPGTASQHTCNMKCTIKTRNTAPLTTNNGTNSCKPRRQNIIESELGIKIKDLQPIRQHHPTLIEIWDTWFPEIRMPWMVSCWTVRSRVRKTPIIKVLRITACCERRLECLGGSISCIDQKIDLDVCPTRSSSRKAQKEAWETWTAVLISSRSLKRSGRVIQNPSIHKKLLYSMAKRSSTRRELEKTKHTSAQVSKEN